MTGVPPDSNDEGVFINKLNYSKRNQFTLAMPIIHMSNFPNKIEVSMFCLMSMMYVESKWRPLTRPTTKHTNLYLPEHVDTKIFNDIKIPNKEYCSEKYKKSLDQYLIMPWWYDHCERLREKYLKKADNKMMAYKYVLKQVDEYKRNGGRMPVRIRLPTAKIKRI